MDEPTNTEEEKCKKCKRTVQACMDAGEPMHDIVDDDGIHVLICGYCKRHTDAFKFSGQQTYGRRKKKR